MHTSFTPSARELTILRRPRFEARASKSLVSAAVVVLYAIIDYFNAGHAAQHDLQHNVDDIQAI